MLAWQYWLVCCHTSTWISHRCIYVPSLLKPPSHLPSFYTPSGCYRAPVWVPWVTQQTSVGYLFYIWSCICYHATLSIHLTLSFHGNTIFNTCFILYISYFIPCMIIFNWEQYLSSPLNCPIKLRKCAKSWTNVSNDHEHCLLYLPKQILYVFTKLLYTFLFMREYLIA